MEDLTLALEVIDRVKNLSSQVQINEHQCRRLAEVYDKIGRSLKQFLKANRESNELSSFPLTPLLKVMEVGELLVSEYAGPDWFRSLVTRGENEEAFEELHYDLKLWVKSLFGINVGGTFFFELAQDAMRDREEMLMKLIDMEVENSSRNPRKKEPRKVIDVSPQRTAQAEEPQIPSSSLKIAIQKLQKVESMQNLQNVLKPKASGKMRKFKSGCDKEMDLYTERRKKKEKLPRLLSETVEGLLKKKMGRKRSLKRERDRDTKYRRTMYSEEKEDGDDNLEQASFLPSERFRALQVGFSGPLSSDGSQQFEQIPDPDLQSGLKSNLLQTEMAQQEVTLESIQTTLDHISKKGRRRKKKPFKSRNCPDSPKDRPHLAGGANKAQEQQFSKKCMPLLQEEHKYAQEFSTVSEKSLILEHQLSLSTPSCEQDVSELMSGLSLSASTLNGDVPDDLKIKTSDIKVTDRVLGKGAFSEVKEAEWLHCKFAVKIMRSRSVSMLRREVKIHKALCHPHIVQLVGFGSDADTCMIVMELMQKDLHELIASRVNVRPGKPPFQTHEAIDLMLQIARGMVFMHSKGVLHGDLKTKNVLAMEEGNHYKLKITDFGVSKHKPISELGIEQKSASFSGNTGSGYFRAPEVLKGTVEYSFKADIYSFAMTSYEILTGYSPFQNKGKPSRDDIMNGTRPHLPGYLNDTLRVLIQRCWHSEEEIRPDFLDICKYLEEAKVSLEGSLHRVWSGLFNPFLSWRSYSAYTAHEIS